MYHFISRVSYSLSISVFPDPRISDPAGEEYHLCTIETTSSCLPSDAGDIFVTTEYAILSEGKNLEEFWPAFFLLSIDALLAGISYSRNPGIGPDTPSANNIKIYRERMGHSPGLRCKGILDLQLRGHLAS
jgi:hypothetical protein